MTISSNEVARISNQMTRAYDGDAWHGKPLRELLRGLTPEQAAQHPIPNAHSIWEIALHLTTWCEVPRQRIQGEGGDPSPERDWPEVGEVSDSAWEAALARLDDAHGALVAAVESLSEDDLERPVPGKSYNTYVMLHGIVQHNLYHAGQIALLRKAVP